MIRKLVISAIAGTCLMAGVNAADAAQYNVNIYGASAQYSYWSAAAPGFLLSQGCDSTNIRSARGNISGGDHGISWCAGSVGVNGVTGKGFKKGTTYDNNDYFIRYTSNASYDGVMGVQGNNTYAPAADITACGSLGGNFRRMADETTASWTVYPATAPAGSVTSLACKEIVVGASDVSASSFTQTSSGAIAPWASPTPNMTPITRSFAGLSIDNTQYTNYRPVVVPFAFFRNSNATQPVPFTNMTRLMATTIFNGQVPDWSYFDNTITPLQVTICFRHAGSGTHATLDKAIMRGDAGLLQNEVQPTDPLAAMGLSPVVWFNNGSTDEMNCIGNNLGAIGYADADKTRTNVTRMTWMGEDAVKAKITQGKYDFWSNQWLYVRNTQPTAIRNLVSSLNTYASNPANMPAAVAATWAAEDEMLVKKDTDSAYPMFK